MDLLMKNFYNYTHPDYRRIKKIIEYLENNHEFPKARTYWNFVGFFYTDQDEGIVNHELAEKYYLRSYEIKPDRQNTSGLGGIYAMKLFIDHGNEAYEQKLCEYYVQAIQFGDVYSMAELADYYVEKYARAGIDMKTPIPLINKTPEMLLLEAYEKEIQPDMSGLVYLYKKLGQYDKCLGLMKHTFYTWPDTQMYLESVIAFMLNSHMYKEYCAFMKESLEVRTKNKRLDVDVTPYLSEENKTGAECFICLKDKSCFKLNCGHLVCYPCLDQVLNDGECKLCKESN